MACVGIVPIRIMLNAALRCGRTRAMTIFGRAKCGDCGHPKADHDHRKGAPAASASRCLHGWRGRGYGCMCPRFEERSTPELQAQRASREAAMAEYVVQRGEK